jgi:PAS domain S-box-containing protein
MSEEPDVSAGLTPDLSSLCVAITEHAPLPMVTVEGASHIVRYVNPAFCRLMDRPGAELIGKPFCEMLPEKGECVALLDRVYRTGESASHTEEQPSEHAAYWTYTMWPVIADKRPAGVMVQVTGHEKQHEKTVAMNEALILGALRQHELAAASESLNAQLRAEIIERGQVEAALRTSEERYRSLFDSMDEGFCLIEMIFDEDQVAVDYRFLEVNPSFGRQSGLLGAAGKRVRELVPDLEAHWFETYGEVALTGKPRRFLHEAKSMGRWFDLYAFRVGGPGSRRVAITFNDITERTKSAEALRESEERYRTLFDLGPVAVYSCDAAGVIQKVNRRAIELWGREPAPGETDEQFCGSHKLFRPDGTFMPHEHCPMADVISGKVAEVRDAEVLIEQPDGNRITVVVNIRPLRNQHGEVTGAINCFYDITERSRLEHKTQEQAEALVDLHRRKDEFLAMLSHELRSPLAPIANAVQMLRYQKNADPLQQQARDIIERQVGQLKHLVDDLLEMSRITSSRVQLHREQVDVASIVEGAVETTASLVAQRGHYLTVSLPPHPVWLHADAPRLEQVVVNLLTNAAKYTDKGGQLSLTVQQEGESIVLRMRDTGVGITPELLPHIFDLFTQEARSLDRSQGGLGIGLSLVQRLVELHGGTVEARSTLGQGSEFVVRLPVVLTSPQLSPAPRIETARPGKPCRVLVVDDNVDTAQSVAMLLTSSGHEVRLAYDGPTALAAAIDYRPDVALLDIGLPGFDGYELAKRIRKQPSLRSVVLVALTGYGQESDRRRSQETGFHHHLVKPADFGKVHKILATVAAANIVEPTR